MLIPSCSSTDTVHDMILERRKCVRHDESLEGIGINLEAFQNYSRSACLMECQARKLYDLCGCLPYYFPDFSQVWNKSTTCGKLGLFCLANETGNSSWLFIGLGHNCSLFGILRTLKIIVYEAIIGWNAQGLLS